VSPLTGMCNRPTDTLAAFGWETVRHHPHLATDLRLSGLRRTRATNWPALYVVSDHDRSSDLEVIPMPATPRSLRSVPRLLILATVGGAVGAGLVSALVSLAGTVPAVIAASTLLGAVAGAAAYLGFEARRRLGRVAKLVPRDTEYIRKQLAQLPTRDQVTSLVFDARNRLHGEISKLGIRTRDDARQLEALLNLHAMIPVRRPLPASRGWSASPDLLLAYVGDILTRKPRLVVECGSGLSTLWAALALETIGGSGRVVALEHDQSYLSATVATLAAHGVAHRAEVRHAPIEQVKVGQEQWPWYALTCVEDLNGIDLLFVDGPIVLLGPQSRYPALPILRDRLNPGAVILLDDANRPEEQEILAHWCVDWPQLSPEMLKLEKGAARIRVPE
jgi:Methyltransferase domain